MRKLTEEELNVFKYLNNLRDSGRINMFGAWVYVADKYQLSRYESNKIVSLWMNNFKENGNYAEVKI